MAQSGFEGSKKEPGIVDAVRDQIVQEARAHARRDVMALRRAVGIGGGADVIEDLLHLDDVALHAGDLGDGGDPALAVAEALQLHDDAHGGGDLAADRGLAHGHAGHADHLLEAGDRLARLVGVDGGHRALVAGVHRLQHVEGLFAAALADDDAIGAHAQRVLDEIALTDLALALDVRRSRLHARDMRLLQLQLGRVLDGDEALGVRNEVERALSIVVLPEPVPPETMVVMRALTPRASRSSICGRWRPSRRAGRATGLRREFADRTSGPSSRSAGSAR